VEAGFEDEVPSIEQLLKQVVRAEADDADLAEVRRGDDGRPTRIDIDFRKNATDDEACYTIRQFQDQSP
jgi:hypothetical protein